VEEGRPEALRVRPREEMRPALNLTGRPFFSVPGILGLAESLVLSLAESLVLSVLG